MWRLLSLLCLCCLACGDDDAPPPMDAGTDARAPTLPRSRPRPDPDAGGEDRAERAAFCESATLCPTDDDPYRVCDDNVCDCRADSCRDHFEDDPSLRATPASGPLPDICQPSPETLVEPRDAECWEHWCVGGDVSVQYRGGEACDPPRGLDPPRPAPERCESDEQCPSWPTRECPGGHYRCGDADEDAGGASAESRCVCAGR